MKVYANRFIVLALIAFLLVVEAAACSETEDAKGNQAPADSDIIAEFDTDNPEINDFDATDTIDALEILDEQTLTDTESELDEIIPETEIDFLQDLESEQEVDLESLEDQEPTADNQEFDFTEFEKEEQASGYQIPTDACDVFVCASIVYPNPVVPGDYLLIGGRFPEITLPWQFTVTFGNGVNCQWYEIMYVSAGALTVQVPQLAASGPVTITYQNPPAVLTTPYLEVVQPDADGFFDCSSNDYGPLGDSTSQPEQFGPYAVGWIDLEILDNQTMLDQVRIHYPAQCFGNRKPPLENVGPFPVLLWVHGDGFSLAQYEDFLQHLSSWGFVSVSFQKNREGENRPAIQKLLTQDPIPDALKPLFDFSRIFMGGHSMGGLATQVLADEFNAMVWISFAGKDALYEGYSIDPSCPSILFGGTNDTQIPPQYSTHPIFERLSGKPKVHVTIDGGNHGQFSDFGVRQATDSEPSIPRAVQHYFVNRYTIAFVRYVILGEEAMRPILQERPTGATIEAVFE